MVDGAAHFASYPYLSFVGMEHAVIFRSWLPLSVRKMEKKYQ
jgi:hypothetical protein